ncbi:hypothetical protein LEP3755_46300 [Leptolyngbya sp. NIES-3755]|nr:hypothetical protein LEP3755_46300 [Leptolyngbya sp. NIES-3755]
MSFMENIKDIAKKAGEEVQKAGDAARTASGDVKARHDMNESELQDAWSKAQAQLFEDLSAEVECYLSDLLLPKEQVVCKMRSSSQGERSQLALTNRCLYIFSKGVFGGQGQDSGGGLLGAALSAGQLSVRVYPIKDVVAFEFKPQKAATVGHFQVLTAATSENDNESKFLLDTKLGYFKSVLVYRKLMELQNAI